MFDRMFSTPMNAVGVFLLLLLVGDAAYLVVHLSHRFLGEPVSPLFNIGRDMGYPELYQYLKEIWAAGLTALYFLRTRKIAFLAWALLIGMLFLDDSLAVHERLGHLFAVRLGLPDVAGIRGQDFGEIIAAGLMVVPFFLTVLVSHRWLSATQRFVSLGFFALIMALAFFGVLIDLFVHKFQDHTLFFIEDGGEMIVVSLLAAFAFSVVIRSDEETARAWPRFNSEK